MEKTLYLIRHGKSLHNINYEKYGSSTFYDDDFIDTPLVDEGIKGSISFGETWSEIENIDIVYVSSLTRALQTATNIFKNIDTPIISLDIIREYPMGKQTCNKRSDKSELVNDFPDINFDNIYHNQDKLWLSDREETIDELDTRINTFINYIKNEPEQNICLIGHSSFIGQLKDKKISLMDNGDAELKYCYPYKINIE